MIIYKKKDNLIYNFHYLTMLIYISMMLFLSLLFSHPLILLALFVSVVMVVISADIIKEWWEYLKFSIGFILLIVLINCIFVRLGTTVLFTGPYLPGLGKIRITLESLCYGMGMSIRLLLIISVFCLLNHVVNPDKVAKLLSRWGSKTTLALCLALRLFPIMREDFARITEVQQSRGVDFQKAKGVKKIKKYISVMGIMLLSSLERAFQQAESMQARGYGLKGRTTYIPDFWKPRDYILIGISTLGVCFIVYLLFLGYGNYNYYPHLQSITIKDIYLTMLLFLIFSFPAILAWGWGKWPILKSKI